MAISFLILHNSLFVINLTTILFHTPCTCMVSTHALCSGGCRFESRLRDQLPQAFCGFPHFIQKMPNTEQFTFTKWQLPLQYHICLHII